MSPTRRSFTAGAGGSGRCSRAKRSPADNLAQVLSIIGADCECGFDHRWLQGTMLPARWDESLQQRVATGLGFDPESPLIRMEMVSIVRRGMGGFDAAGVPLGYRETLVGGDVTDSNTGADQVASVNEPGVTLLRPGPVQANIEVKQEVRGLGILAVSLGGMIVLVAVASVVVLLKAKRA